MLSTASVLKQCVPKVGPMNYGKVPSCRSLIQKLIGGKDGHKFMKPAYKLNRTNSQCCVRWYNTGNLVSNSPSRCLRMVDTCRSRLVRNSARHWGLRSTTMSQSFSAQIGDEVKGIQKHISPLSLKRAARKKKMKVPMSEKDQFSVAAYATSEEYHLEDIVKELNEQGLYEVCDLTDDAADALRAVAKYSVGEELREFYLFREGSIVFWNFTESEANSVLKFLRDHEVNAYDVNLVNLEYEEMTYKYTQDNTRLQSGDIFLKTLPSSPTEDDLEKSTLERYAFSNALALSVKLGVWEASLAKYVEDIEWVTEDLRAGRMLRITRREVSRKTGELFTLRHLINLSSDLLDTPDFYWDREQLESIYLKTSAHFNITKRTRVMNEKLSHCCELTELLTTTLNDAHHVRLEWMIIVLILVEVVFEFMHVIESDNEKYIGKADNYKFSKAH